MQDKALELLREARDLKGQKQRDYINEAIGILDQSDKRTKIDMCSPIDGEPPMLTTDADSKRKAFIATIAFPVYDSGEHQAHNFICYEDTIERELQEMTEDVDEAMDVANTLSIGDSMFVDQTPTGYNFYMITRIR